jgi:hypothetical protein
VLPFYAAANTLADRLTTLDRFSRGVPPYRILAKIAGKLFRLGPDTRLDEAPDESDPLPTVHKVTPTKSIEKTWE